ncbi:MAG: ATP-dependent RecD-like DNA helicase [Chlamydiae bacterium]|nr:ATP-dependent RecD-like DNA helicase [Chlamydiota bacterium]
MDELFGYLENLVFTSEDGSFSVAKLKEPKKQELTLIVGPLPGVTPGESIRCKGKWGHHPKHGAQFTVSSFETEAPRDAVGIQKYLESGMIRGIGPAYAERIVKKFGALTLQVIDEDPGKLLQVAGIGEKRLSRIITCWEEQRAIRNVMIFLRGHEVSPSFAQKIYKTYGDDSIAKVKENPYRLAKEIRGIGFKSADQIAQKIGITLDAPTRLDAGIEHVLWELSSEGHVCVPVSELFEAASAILDISAPALEPRLLHLKNEGSVVVEEEHAWIRPLYLAEVGIAREMKRLKETSSALRAVQVEKALEWASEKLSLHFADLQSEAIAGALSKKILLLTGGPGTGKSTITRAILEISSKLTSKIILAAPTGRAAKRLSEITGAKASTIHSLLEMDFVRGGFKKNRDRPLDAELLIIDEASMIDTNLMYALLKAIPSHARLILVGDIDQLPSVGPGNVLRDLIESTLLPTCRLHEIFRQGKGSDIVANAHKINLGEFPRLYCGKESDFHFIEKETPEEILSEITTLVTHRLPRKYHFHKFEDIQVLTPMKRGVIGTENLNAALQQALNPSPHPLTHFGRRFHIGDKVMQLRNNYQKEIYNGDIGIIQEIDLGEQTLSVRFDGKVVLYDFSELDELQLAYAVSIHKYQGSECPCIILPVHTTHFKLLFRNLLYTGLTRGKKLVVLLGTKKALAIAINTEEVKKRHTGLKRQLSHFLKN